jgi:hypothetical protein
MLCAPELKEEPTVTVTKFEIILALDVDTRLPWLGFTIEAIFLPFDRESTPDLEFEAKRQASVGTVLIQCFLAASLHAFTSVAVTRPPAISRSMQSR